jgi:hypothetical protein
MRTPYATRLTLTSLEGRDVPSTTNLFAANWYLANNPDVAVAVQNGQFASAEEHFRLHGDAELRSGNPLFDTDMYLAHNVDVRDAVGNSVITAFRHFELHGQFERRDPMFAFQTSDYIGANSDVALAVQGSQMSAFEHFWLHGQFEDRLPYNGFDRSSYLEENPDVAAAVAQGLMTTVEHFVNFGRNEDRMVRHSIFFDMSSGQSTVTGISENNDDTKYFIFTAPVSGTLTVNVQSRNGGDVAQAEVEDTRTNIDLLITDPNTGTNTGTALVQEGVQYFLRMRAPGALAADFIARLSIV